MTLKKLSVGSKLNLACASVVMLCLSVSTLWITQNARYETEAQALAEARALGQAYALEVKGTLDEGMEQAKQYAVFLESQIAEGAPNRALILSAMRRTMERAPDMAGLWAGFEPNAYDGNDAAFAGKTPFHDATGRFIPYFYNFGKGVQPYRLTEYQNAGELGDYYRVPKRDKRPLLMQPVMYDIEGSHVLLSSAAYPILDRKTKAFLGVAGTDIYLNTLAKRLAGLKPFGTGSLYLISNSGRWVSHGDPALLGKAVDDADPIYAAALPHVRKGTPFVYAGADFTHMFVPLAIKDSARPWSLVVNIPNAVLTEEADDLQADIILASLVAVLSLAAFLYVITGILIATPMHAITGVLAELEKGNDDIAVPYQNRGDEIGNLGRALARFRDSNRRIKRLEEERRKVEEDAKRVLAFQAHHDPLTGLHNRFALAEVAKTWMRPNAPPFALLFIDLDNFKNINDAFGHACGDIILVEAAKRLKASIPESSEVTRHGGDEFILFVRTGDIVSIDLTCAAIIAALTESYLVSGMKLHIGASIGIALFPQDGMLLEQVIVSADLAMRTAKQRKNSYAFFNHALQDAMRKKVNIEHQLRQALDGDEIYMVFQPQIAGDGRIHGAEALARWENPELGFVPPEQFIAVAEETGLIKPLGDFIIRQSCAEFSRILRECGAAEGMSLSINISVRQILEEGFKDKLLRVVAENRLSNRQVILEITESLFIEEPEAVLPLLQDIRKSGVAISLDDFGTGYSSLSTLRILPIDELKIDKSFVENICRVDQDSKMIRSIIDMGHTMKMRVLAEGVEENSQRLLLKDYGCDVYQGYFFSRPLKPDDFIAFAKTFAP